jgi:hypothetical protein
MAPGHEGPCEDPARQNTAPAPAMAPAPLDMGSSHRRGVIKATI